MTKISFESLFKNMKVRVQTKEVREAILDTTDKLLARFGYSKMTIDDLAKEVGIGKGSIYLHFKSKEEIVLSLTDRVIERLCSKLNKIADENTSHKERLCKMIATRVTFRFDAVHHYSTSIDELLASLRSQILRRRKKYHAAEAKALAKVIADGQKNKVFVEGDPIEIAHAFLLATNALLPLSLSTKELGKRNEIKKKVDLVANLLLRGIRKF